MSDDDIWRLNRGGHDPLKVFNAYQAAMAHKGQPTVILAKTIKGYGMGKSGEGLNITHQQKKLDDDALKDFRDRFNIPVSDEDIGSVPYYRPAEGSEELKYLQERRKALGGYLPQRRPKADSLSVPPLEAFASLLGGLGRARVLDDDGARAPARRAAQGQGDRVARRADRSRRGAHLRHGGPVPPDRHLLLDGPAVHAAGRGPAAVLPRGQEGPDPRGGHQRRRRDVQLDRRRHGVRQPRRQHDPVLHLLLDVRLPARRRLHLGRRRHAESRLPDRRHGGPHHARGRRPAAPGRPQPARRDDDPELRGLRPDVRLRARGDRAGRPAPHVRRAGKRLLLHHLHERELRAPGDAGGRGGRAS